MISLITVVLDSVIPYLPHFLKSVSEKLEKVDEVLLPKVDLQPEFYKEWQQNNIIFKMFGAKHAAMKYSGPTANCVHHALGLHAGINKAKNDLIMTCDPDTFFYSSADKLYADLMNSLQLNCIGLSHPSAIAQCFTFFPNVVNMMFKKSEMPNKEFLKEHLTLNKAMKIGNNLNDLALPGMFLLPSEMPETKHYFPKPDGHYETGCQLTIWAKENNWRWLAFQTPDCYNYSTQYFKSNFKVTQKIPRQKLLYHVLHGAAMSDKYDVYLNNFNIEFSEEKE